MTPVFMLSLAMHLVVALRIERSATRLSAAYGRPALDYLRVIKSGASESNREPPAPKAGVLPTAPPPDVSSTFIAPRGGVEPANCGLKDRHPRR